MDVIFSFVILLRIGHKNFAVEIPNTERPITSRKIRIDEANCIHMINILIESQNLASMEICRIQEIVTVGDAEGCALVDGAVNTAVCSVVDRNNGVRWVYRRVPT